jgi:hypothetical protein
MQNENFDEEIEKELDKRMDELKKNLNAKRKKRINHEKRCLNRRRLFSLKAVRFKMRGYC